MKTLSLLAIMLCFSLSSFAQLTPAKNKQSLSTNGSGTTTINTTSNNSLSTQNHIAAKNFGLQMVENYFTNNCQNTASNFASELMSMETGETFQNSTQLQQLFCAENPLRSDIQVTYSMYTQNYLPLVLDHTQFAQQYPQLQELYNLQAGDFWFNGANLKEGATELFRASDMATMLLKKTNTGFQIIGM